MPARKAAVPSWPADKVERRAVADLIPYARNARTHSPAQVAQIAASIREWGWTVPVLVDEAGVLIAGHGRVMAAKQLGLVDVPAMVARGWSETQRRAYVLADNRLALNAGWDTEMLRAELADLQEGGADLALAGFSDGEVADLLGAGDLLAVDGIGAASQFDKATVKWGDKVVPVTDEELAELNAAYDSHYGRNGVAFGFVRSLLHPDTVRAEPSDRAPPRRRLQPQADRAGGAGQA